MALDKKQKSNWGGGERFKDLEKDDRILLNPQDQKEIKRPQKSNWGEASRFKNPEKDDRLLLYPKYDLSRPNLHGNKSVMKRPTKQFPSEKE